MDLIDHLELRWGQFDYGALRFYEDGFCPPVRWGDFVNFATGRVMVPFTALRLPG